MNNSEKKAGFFIHCGEPSFQMRKRVCHDYTHTYNTSRKLTSCLNKQHNGEK